MVLTLDTHDGQGNGWGSPGPGWQRDWPRHPTQGHSYCRTGCVLHNSGTIINRDHSMTAALGIVQCATCPAVHLPIQHTTGRARAETQFFSSNSEVTAHSSIASCNQKTPPLPPPSPSGQLRAEDGGVISRCPQGPMLGPSVHNADYSLQARWQALTRAWGPGCPGPTPAASLVPHQPPGALSCGSPTTHALQCPPLLLWPPRPRPTH